MITHKHSIFGIEKNHFNPARWETCSFCFVLVDHESCSFGSLRPCGFLGSRCSSFISLFRRQLRVSAFSLLLAGGWRARQWSRPILVLRTFWQKRATLVEVINDRGNVLVVWELFFVLASQLRKKYEKMTRRSIRKRQVSVQWCPVDQRKLILKVWFLHDLWHRLADEKKNSAGLERPEQLRRKMTSFTSSNFLEKLRQGPS